MKSNKLSMGLMIGLVIGWATVAQAFDTSWFRPTVRQADPPKAAEPKQFLDEQLANETSAQTENIKDQLGCGATPDCGNGYVLSQALCPNLLPGKIPAENYPVKSCYICNLPPKVANIPKEQLCLLPNYGCKNDAKFSYWNEGSYTCSTSYSPYSFIQACPAGMGTEGIFAYYSVGDICQLSKYSCRFAPADKEICKQCGAVAISGGYDGQVYCVLPSNLPPADPNKPCGK